MKRFVERDRAVEGEACVTCNAQTYWDWWQLHFFNAGNCLNPEQAQKEQGADLLSPSSDYNSPATVRWVHVAFSALEKP